MLPNRLRAIFVGLGLLAAVLAQPARAADDAASFIQHLGDRGIQIMQDPAATRKAEFSTLFTDSFDVAAIGKFVLGRYWNTATPQQQQEYLSVFGPFVVAVYSERFAGYTGYTFKVVGSTAVDSTTMLVTSEINRPTGGPPIHIQWKVQKTGDAYKIVDVVVENLSMMITQRSDFSSVIERNGGNVQALIDMLKQKAAS